MQEFDLVNLQYQASIGACKKECGAVASDRPLARFVKLHRVKKQPGDRLKYIISCSLCELGNCLI
jgi:hypothetical protein